MLEDAAVPVLLESETLAALDLPHDVRAGVAQSLALLAEHWRRFRDDAE